MPPSAWRVAVECVFDSRFARAAHGDSWRLLLPVRVRHFSPTAALSPAASVWRGGVLRERGRGAGAEGAAAVILCAEHSVLLPGCSERVL